jgi:16S rRNA (uracil1498-N3)-methyltransferase
VRRVYLHEGLPDGAPEVFDLPVDAAHYVLRVLRLGPGDPLRLLDRAGRHCHGVLRIAAPGTVSVEVREWAPAQSDSLGPEIALWAGLTRTKAWDWMLQKATELGATEVCPMALERSVTDIPPGKVGDRVDRWQRICGEAARQCESPTVPAVRAPRDLATWLADAPRRDDELRVVLLERSGAQPLRQVLSGVPRARCLVASGPEGGFSGEEARALVAGGFEPVSCGSRILRAETAPLYALAAIDLFWG